MYKKSCKEKSGLIKKEPARQKLISSFPPIGHTKKQDWNITFSSLALLRWKKIWFLIQLKRQRSSRIPIHDRQWRSVLLIQEADSQSRLVVITNFTCVVRPHIRPHFSKSSKTNQSSSENSNCYCRDCVSGEWIIDDMHILFCFILKSGDGWTNNMCEYSDNYRLCKGQLSKSIILLSLWQNTRGFRKIIVVNCFYIVNFENMKWEKWNNKKNNMSSSY